MTGQPSDLSGLPGRQEVTDEDRAYKGSRFSELRDALLQNPYRPGKYGQGPGALPLYRSTIRNAWKGSLPGGHPPVMTQAAARTVDSRADLRWGEDGRGYRKVVAPNGIVMWGTWEITADNPYTGYFAPGSRGLIFARYSSDGNETKRGQRRSLSLAGKLYPTADEDHAEPLVPAGFMAQEDLGGERTDYINDAELRNAPNVSGWRRGIYGLILVRAGLSFMKVDKIPDSRQVYEIAEIGKPPGEPTQAPKHMRLKMAAGQRRVEGDGLDYRDEIYRHLFEPGEEEPTGSIVYDLSVSDTGKGKGIQGFRRVHVENWQQVGTVTFTHAVASYNADHVIHFHHPGWRHDRNDPATAVRSGERRVN